VTGLDASGRAVVEVDHGDLLTVRLSVRMDPALDDRRVTFVLGFARHGSPYSAYVHRDALLLPSSTDCVIEVTLDAVCLGSGKWYVNIGIGQAALYERRDLKYFTIDAGWHHLLATRIELNVRSISAFDASGCFAVLPARVDVGSPDRDQLEERLDPSDRTQAVR